MIELKDSSGQPEQGIQPKNNKDSKAQMFVILLLASMSYVMCALYLYKFCGNYLLKAMIIVHF